MDALVATEIMEWARGSTSVNPTTTIPNVWKTGKGIDFKVQASIEWSPSRDISDVWLVVKKLAEIIMLI